MHVSIKAKNLRVEVGEIPKEKNKGIIYFSNFEEMNKVLNNNRIELLEIIKKEKPDSIYQLAIILNRDQGNVTKDVNILEKNGFIDVIKTKEGKRVKSEPVIDSEGIEMIIKLGAGAFGLAKETFEQVSKEFKNKNLEKNTEEFKKTYKKAVKPLKQTVKKIAKKFDIKVKE
jgi:predicted transcriptional regulator